MAEEQKEQKSGSSWSINKKVFLSFLLFWVVCLLAMYVWKILDEQRFENVGETEKQAVVEAASKVVREQAEQFLTFNATYLAWAISKPLIEEDYEGISNLFNKLIKTQNFKIIMAAKPDGTVFVSTDKKYENTELSKIVDPAILEIDEVNLRSEAATIQVAVPVFDKTAKLGLLVIIYEPEGLSADLPVTIR